MKFDGSTDLSPPFEHEGELCEKPNFATGLFLGVDGLQLSLCSGELDLAGEGFVELCQLVEIVTDGPEPPGFFDSGRNLNQLFAFPKDDFFGFVVEKMNEWTSPWFVDREIELEFLLRSTISVSKDCYVGLEDPGGGLWGGLYGERTIGRSRETTETDAR